MTAPLTPERLGEIRALAEAATAKGWAAFSDDTGQGHTNLVAFDGCTRVVFSLPGRDKREPDIQYLEAAEPATVLALLDALTSTRERAERAEAERDEAREDARQRLAQRSFDEAYARVEPVIRAVLTAPIGSMDFAVETAANEVLEAAFRHTFDADWKALTSRATAAEARVAELEGLLREAGEVVEELLTHSVAHYGRPKDEEWGVGLYHARARALSAKLEGRGDG